MAPGSALSAAALGRCLQEFIDGARGEEGAADDAHDDALGDEVLRWCDAMTARTPPLHLLLDSAAPPVAYATRRGACVAVAAAAAVAAHALQNKRALRGAAPRGPQAPPATTVVGVEDAWGGVSLPVPRAEVVWGGTGYVVFNALSDAMWLLVACPCGDGDGVMRRAQTVAAAYLRLLSGLPHSALPVAAWQRPVTHAARTLPTRAPAHSLPAWLAVLGAVAEAAPAAYDVRCCVGKVVLAAPSVLRVGLNAAAGNPPAVGRVLRALMQAVLAANPHAPRPRPPTEGVVNLPVGVAPTLEALRVLVDDSVALLGSDAAALVFYPELGDFCVRKVRERDARDAAYVAKVAAAAAPAAPVLDGLIEAYLLWLLDEATPLGAAAAAAAAAHLLAASPLYARACGALLEAAGAAPGITAAAAALPPGALARATLAALAGLPVKVRARVEKQCLRACAGGAAG